MKYIFLIFFCLSCAHSKGNKFSNEKIEVFCQDLNVLHTKLSLITSNIVNIKTTRVPKGGHYKRKVASNCVNGFCTIEEMNDHPLLKYEPAHPDANSKGYVTYPGYSLESEKYEKTRWSRIYEAVIQDFGIKSMQQFFLHDPRAKGCFERYPEVNEGYNYKKYLGR